MPAYQAATGYAGLEGTITVGNYEGAYFGYSNGSLLPSFGSVSGPAASFIGVGFIWAPDGAQFITTGLVGGEVLFLGASSPIVFNSDNDWFEATFMTETTTFPTSGTYPFSIVNPVYG